MSFLPCQREAKKAVLYWLPIPSRGDHQLRNQIFMTARRSPYSSIEGLHHGAWTEKEDIILCEYIRNHGDSGGWTNLPPKAGLKRSGKSCRLRWLNYLRPDIKRGSISSDEEDLIIRLHRLLGNRWSLIAGRLPGRTDNEIKNYWNTHLSRKMLAMKESRRNSRTRNVNERSKYTSPIQNHVFKSTPVKITLAVRHSEMVKPIGFNGYKCSNYHRSDEALRLCNVKEIATERIGSEMAGVNVVEAEVRNSPACSMLSSADDESQPHSDHFAGDAATLADILLDLNDLSSPRWSLFFSPPDSCSTDFGLEELYRRAAAEMNEFEDNMQRVHSLTVDDYEVS